MASKLVLVLVIAVIINQTACEPESKVISGTKGKLTSSLTSAKSKVTDTAKGAKSKVTDNVNSATGLVTDTAKGAKSKVTDNVNSATGLVTSSAKGATSKISDTAGDVKGLVGLKRDGYATEDLENEDEYTIEPEDIYEYVEEHYPHLRSLLEEYLQIEPEDDEEPERKPQDKKDE